MRQTFNLVICPKCRANLETSSSGIAWLHCPACNQNFPLISGRIPLLMEQPYLYLANLYLQHNHYLRRQQKKIIALENAAHKEPARHDFLTLMAGALKKNLSLTESASTELPTFLTAHDIVTALDAPGFISYTTTLEYLERDWCWLAPCERELRIIRDALLERYAQYAPDSDSALVLGAGTARIAWDLRTHFNQVYALDGSLTLAQQFHNLLNRDVEFYSIRTSSIFEDADMIQKRCATLVPPGYRQINEVPNSESFYYLIGDVCRIPLREESISTIVSVYFTDVVPLKHYLGEVLRVLKQGGVFLHFGPLEYHFDDITQHLSAEQIKCVFESNGFKIVSEDSIKSEHLHIEGAMSHQIFENWVFCAIRGG